MTHGTKTFDAPISKTLFRQKLAAEIANQVRAAATDQRVDPDDASTLGGQSFRRWLESLLYEPSFVREVEMQLGFEFNGEFFIDGFRGEHNE